MDSSEIVEFLKTRIEPLPDAIYGDRYRAAARLTDGTYLLCVVFQSKRRQVELALRRFRETKKEPTGYRRVVETFVASGTSVGYYEVSEVEISPFAWPLSTLVQIHGETTMGWTAFVAEMSDGRCFSYGTAFRFEFFDLPAGYGNCDISRIHSGMVYSDSKGIQPSGLGRNTIAKPLREKPFFTCYLDGLDDLIADGEGEPSRSKRQRWTRFFGKTE